MKFNNKNVVPLQNHIFCRYWIYELLLVIYHDSNISYVFKKNEGSIITERKISHHKFVTHIKNFTRNLFKDQKQPPRGVLSKRCFENMQQTYRRTPMRMCDFNKVVKLQSNFVEITLRHGCSPVNLLHISRTTFSKNNCGWLLLKDSLPGKS